MIPVSLQALLLGWASLSPAAAYVLERRDCSADNCLRAFLNTQSAPTASSFCSSFLAACVPATATTWFAAPTFLTACGTPTQPVSRLSSACGCLLGTATPSATTPCSTSTSITSATTCPQPSTTTATITLPASTATATVTLPGSMATATVTQPPSCPSAAPVTVTLPALTATLPAVTVTLPASTTTSTATVSVTLPVSTIITTTTVTTQGSPVFCPTANVIANGDFSAPATYGSPPPDWSVVGGFDGNSTYAVDCYSGVCEFDTNFNPLDTVDTVITLNQTVSICNAGTYEFQMLYQNSFDDCSLTVSINGDSTIVGYPVDDGTDDDDTGWQNFQTYLRFPATTPTAMVDVPIQIQFKQAAYEFCSGMSIKSLGFSIV